MTSLDIDAYNHYYLSIIMPCRFLFISYYFRIEHIFLRSDLASKVLFDACENMRLLAGWLAGCLSLACYGKVYLNGDLLVSYSVTNACVGVKQGKCPYLKGRE